MIHDEKLKLLGSSLAKEAGKVPLTLELGPINTRTGNYSAKYLFYRYDDVVAMILLVTRLKNFVWNV